MLELDANSNSASQTQAHENPPAGTIRSNLPSLSTRTTSDVETQKQHGRHMVLCNSGLWRVGEVVIGGARLRTENRIFILAGSRRGLLNPTVKFSLDTHPLLPATNQEPMRITSRWLDGYAEEPGADSTTTQRSVPSRASSRGASLLQLLHECLRHLECLLHWKGSPYCRPCYSSFPRIGR